MEEMLNPPYYMPSYQLPGEPVGPPAEQRAQYQNTLISAQAAGQQLLYNSSFRDDRPNYQNYGFVQNVAGAAAKNIYLPNLATGAINPPQASVVTQNLIDQLRALHGMLPGSP